MLGFGLFGMLWERQDFVGNSFPPEVCEKILQSMQTLSTLNPAAVISGITATEFSVVCCAADYPKRRGGQPVTVAEIAAQMAVSVPAVSRTLRSLQDKGLITRQVNENDRRSVKVSVTDEGHRLLEQNLNRITTAMNTVMSAFTDEEIRVIAELYSKFAAAMKTLRFPDEADKGHAD